MIEQTYQEVSRIIAEDLKDLKKQGIEKLGEIDVQKYFFEKKKENPEKYERLMFDTNGPEPFSKDLSSIIMDFRLCGILETKYDCIK